MKPLVLKFQGLNNFSEPMQVDFGALLERGLFGIFGPTGSGKSTLLDGITLSLYGEIARKTKDYINVHSQEMKVSLLFSLPADPHCQYRVERVFKRTGGSEESSRGVENKDTRLVELRAGQEYILEDKTKAANRRLIDLIGLSAEDFTRTVVLPQGRFSEFLRLEDRKRRDMLERIFRLETYGDALSARVSAKASNIKAASKENDGRLSMLEDISALELENLQQNLTSRQRSLLLQSQEIEKLQEVYQLRTRLFEAWQTKERLAEKIRQQEAARPDIEKKRQLLQELFKVSSLLPYVEQEAKSQKRLEDLQAELSKAQSLYQETHRAFEECCQRAEQAAIAYRQLPVLQEQLERLRQASSHWQEAAQLQARQQESQALLHQGEQKHTAKRAELEQAEQALGEARRIQAQTQAKMHSLHVPQEKREALSHAKEIERQLSELSQDEQALNLQIQAADQAAESARQAVEKSQKERLEAQNRYETLQEERRQAQQSEQADPAWVERTEQQLQLRGEQIKASLENQQQQQTVCQQIQEKQKERKRLGQLCLEKEEALSKALATLRQHERTAAIAHLQEELSPGQPCPVCQSCEHSPLLEKKTQAAQSLPISPTQVESLRASLSSAQGDWKVSARELARLEEQLEELQKAQSSLGQGLPTEQDLAKSRQAWKDFKEQGKQFQNFLRTCQSALEQVQARLSVLNEAYHQQQRRYDACQSQRAGQAERLQSVQQKRQKLQTNLTDLLQTYQIQDLSEALAELNHIDQEQRVCQKTLEQSEEKCKAEEQNLQALSQAEKEAQIQTASMRASLEALSEQIQSLRQKATLLAPEYSSSALLETIQAHSEHIKSVQENYEHTHKEREEAHMAFQNANGQRAHLQKSFQEQSQETQQLSLRIQEHLESAALSKERALQVLLPLLSQKESFQSEVTLYDQQAASLQDTLAQLEEILQGEVFDLLSYQRLTQDLQERKEQQLILEREIAVLQEKILNQESRLKEKNQLLKESQALTRQMDLLSELQGLLRGKKFVEFAATRQLGYITAHASDTLFDISSGQYRLELTELNTFLIRDFKNGGALRQVNSLSGGETFLVSLCLSLALSAGIQLKGRSSLEFFFLDEGFGTLDEDLLDTVIGGLEKLQHHGLAIGLISHVEMLKERVPIKLILQRDPAGTGNSILRLEKS